MGSMALVVGESGHTITQLGSEGAPRNNHYNRPMLTVVIARAVRAFEEVR